MPGWGVLVWEHNLESGIRETHALRPAEALTPYIGAEAGELLVESVEGASMKAKLFTWLRILVSLSLLVLLLKSIGAEGTFEVIAQGSPLYLLAAFAVYLLGVVVRAYRWQVWLQAQGISLPLHKLTALYFVGAFFTLFLPTGVGGDAVRMVEVAKGSDRKALTASTVLVDRASGLLVLLAIALVSLPFSYRLVTPEVVTAIVVLNGLGCGAMLLLLEQSATDALARHVPPLAWLLKRKPVEAIYLSLKRYDGLSLVKTSLVSLLFNALLILTNILVGRAVGVEVPLGYFLLFVPIISFLLALPISVSGLGIREGGYVFLFGQAGVSSPMALSMSLCIYAMMVGTGLIGGVIYALQGFMGLRAGER